jgi:hypothetical protein
MSFADSRALPVRKIIKVVPDDGDDVSSPVVITNGSYAMFTLDTCIDGDRIPNRIRIQGIRVFPFTMISGAYSGVSTIWRTLLYANSSRLFAEYDANWSDFTLETSEPALDETNLHWVCQTGAGPNGEPGGNTIYGRINIKAGENDSAFRVVVLFT